MDFDYKYLDEDMLRGFDTYKYSAVDTNPLSIYIMHPFWNRVVRLCPSWVAPNLLTFLGFTLMLASWTFLAYHDFHFNGSVPEWLLLVCPVLIFLGYTLDGIDGKQARITGTSGPLGELFDHGLDSITAVLIPTSLYSAFGRSVGSVPPVRYYCVLWNVFLTFYLTHWEKYITGTLFLPWGYDFSMLSTVAVFVSSYFLGENMLTIDIGFGVTTGNALEAVFYLTSIIATLPVTLYNICKSYKNKTGKNLPVCEALRPMIPLTGLMALTIFWGLTSPSAVIETHPRAFYMFTGTVFSNITCRLVVAQMSATQCESWNSLVNVVAIGFLFSRIVPLLEILIVYVIWIYTTFCHIHYGTCVVRQMCDHLRIKCFKITPKTE